MRCVATLVPARGHGRPALFGIAWGGPVTGATHTYLAQQRMNFHFTFPARLAPPLLRPFQVQLSAVLVACYYWDSILARRAGRVGPGQLSCSSHRDALMHRWRVGAVERDSSWRGDGTRMSIAVAESVHFVTGLSDLQRLLYGTFEPQSSPTLDHNPVTILRDTR